MAPPTLRAPRARSRADDGGNGLSLVTEAANGATIPPLQVDKCDPDEWASIETREATFELDG